MEIAETLVKRRSCGVLDDEKLAFEATIQLPKRGSAAILLERSASLLTAKQPRLHQNAARPHCLLALEYNLTFLLFDLESHHPSVRLSNRHRPYGDGTSDVANPFEVLRAEIHQQDTDLTLT